MAEMVVRAKFGETFEYPPEPFFIDVPASAPRFRFIQKLREEKLTMAGGGYAPMFSPDSTATRYQVATFLVRTRFGETFTVPETPPFADVPPSHANFRYVMKATGDGLMKECRPRYFCPGDAPSREEVKALVASYLGGGTGK